MKDIGHKMKSLVTITCFLGLTACTSMIPSNQPPLNQPMSWPARQTELSQIKSWTIKGAIAIQTEKQAETAYINWSQNEQNYQMHIFGPLGIASVTIDGKPGKIIMALPNQAPVEAKTPENLLPKELGWTLPVSNLFFWIRGLPISSKPAIKKFDAYHHLTQLKQSGWTIQYLRYTGVKNTDLPSKIFLTYPNLSLRIIVSQWQI